MLFLRKRRKRQTSLQKTDGLEDLLDALDGPHGVLIGAKGGQAEIALAGGAEAGTGGTHHLGLMKQGIEEVLSLIHI